MCPLPFHLLAIQRIEAAKYEILKTDMRVCNAVSMSLCMND